MGRTCLHGLCLATLLAGPALAQGVVESAEAAEPIAGPRAKSGKEVRTEPDDEVRIALRVTNVLGTGRATVDRGAVDGLEVGDVVWLTPREGGRFRADVRSVDERSAVIEMATATFVPVAGTPGEALLPAERFIDPNAPDPAVPVGTGDVTGDRTGNDITGDRAGTDTPPGTDRPTPTWQREDDGFTDDQPLLSGMRAVRPSDRAPFMSGRIYVAADGRFTSDAGRSDYFTRVGTDLAYENPFGRSGLLEVGAEWDRRHFDRPELDDLSDTELRVERLSYSLGGTRFGDDRLRFGRFLQGGMAEFGVLDGVEWSRAISENHAFGASVGFMPPSPFSWRPPDRRRSRPSSSLRRRAPRASSSRFSRHPMRGVGSLSCHRSLPLVRFAPPSEYGKPCRASGRHQCPLPSPPHPPRHPPRPIRYTQRF